MTGIRRHLLQIVLLFSTTLLAGALGYRVIEGWPFLEGLYMSIITVTTVGFSEIRPLSPDGRLFTAFLIVVGVLIITYSFGAITRYFVAGELRGFLGEQRMKRLIASMRDHVIVCGFGRMGQEVCHELQREGRAFIVVDQKDESAKHAQEEGYIAHCGDPGLDETLRECRIDKSIGLVAASDDDAQNLMVVLSARALRPDLAIVARVSADDGPEKFLRAGANNVFLPYKTGGRRLSQLLLRPEVVGFLEHILHDESALGIMIEDFIVGDKCEIRGMNLRDAKIRERTGVYVVGIKRKDTGIHPEITPTTVLESGDTIIALGKREQLDKLNLLLSNPD